MANSSALHNAKWPDTRAMGYFWMLLGVMSVTKGMGSPHIDSSSLRSPTLSNKAITISNQSKPRFSILILDISETLQLMELFSETHSGALILGMPLGVFPGVIFNIALNNIVCGVNM